MESIARPRNAGTDAAPMSRMSDAAGAGLPDLRTCEQARQSRDPRFDGLFFTAVTSTRIYCRPVCPAPTPKPGNIVYYASAASAEAAGFRPCLRCRPELSPADGSWRRGDALVARALKLIDAGALVEQPLGTLAQRLDIGERQLRRVFVERLGATPTAVHATRRLLFAKQLLTETALPITQVALAAGYGSLRRFNTTFRDAYRMAPRDLRRQLDTVDDVAQGVTLRLSYRPPYDFGAMLDFLRGRALPGVESVGDDHYVRLIGNADTPGWLRVSAWPRAHALRLELHGVESTQLLAVVARVRRMFDLDADPLAIASALEHDPRLSPLLQARPGLRLPSGWDGFEIAVRAIIGQQVSVAAARTITARLASRFGCAVAMPAQPGLTHLFPTPTVLTEADLDGLGLTGARAQTLRTVAQAVLDGRVDLNPEHTLDDFVRRWTALPGIGAWTANYLALRALGHPDAFPADDLVLQRAVPADGSRLSAKALATRADEWRPWRGYAVIHLWRDTMTQARAPAVAAPAAGMASDAAPPRRRVRAAAEQVQPSRREKAATRSHRRSSSS